MGRRSATEHPPWRGDRAPRNGAPRAHTAGIKADHMGRAGGERGEAGPRCQCHQPRLGVPGGGKAAAAAAAAAASPHRAPPSAAAGDVPLRARHAPLRRPRAFTHRHSCGARQTVPAQPPRRRRRRHRARLHRRLRPFLLPAPASRAPAAASSPRSPPAPAPTSELRALVGWRARHSRPPRSPRPLPRRPRPARCFLRGQSGGRAPPPPGPRSGVSVAARLGLGKENGRGVALGGEGLHPNPLGFRPCPAHTPRPRWQPCQASPAQPQWPRSPRWIGTRVGRRPKERMRDAGGHRVTVAQISSLTCLPRHGMRSRSPPLPEGHLRTDPRRLTATPRTSQEVGASLGIMERAE
ncbi:sterile alpha motif domain-containing protein 1-like [Equus quagga]|uniref:sterile alpha motif domain-containing protein 1-like n=1 Tax=Equus quagga TaxID=89248 RepID=UPI001EE31609|nr:sterile alpha motif domain-containing protein 1-like [Equus quagga]